MLGQMSTAMAKAGLNIHNMLNKSRGEMAYTLVDVDSPVPADAIETIRRIEGVLAIRYLPLGPAHG
jgi:D-3-phosphoglycerate dehydrogenase